MESKSRDSKEKSGNSNGMKEKNKIEHPYALYFFLLSVTILALSYWVIWFDTVKLRPWIDYQKEYYLLKREQLENRYKDVVDKFQSAETQQQILKLKAQLEQFDEYLQHTDVREKYESTIEELNNTLKALKNNKSEFRTARGTYLEREYLFNKYQRDDDKAMMLRLEQEIMEIEKRKDELSIQEEALKTKLDEFTGESKRIAAELSALEAPVQNAKEMIDRIHEVPIEIKQVYMADINKADRCQSCHIGIESLDNISDLQPFAQHPAQFIYLKNHRVDEFGCTFCHRGQGRATSSEEKGHGWVEHWLEPMHRGKFAQASCETCHGDVQHLRGGSLIAQGSELVEKNGCYGCHKIAGYENLRKVGPNLTEVGTKVNYSWLVNWLLDPKDYFNSARMPKFYFSRGESEAIADYLFSMTRENRKDELAHEIDWELADIGKTIWRKSRCTICHATNEVGGAHEKIYAPDLGKVGSKVNREWLYRWIKDPKEYYPLTKMPRFRFTDHEVRALVEYTFSEFIDWDFEPQFIDSEPIKVESIQKGKSLIQKYGCFGCHNVKGMEEMKRIGPYLRTEEVTYLKIVEINEIIGSELTSIGSKALERLDFGKMAKNIPHDRISYLKQKLRAPRSFRDNLRMPDFRFSDNEIEALTVLLSGFTDTDIPTRFKVPKEAVDYRPTGEFAKIVDDLKCLNCHSFKGNGEDFAPDLTIEGSKVQENWLREFLKQPDIIRPMLKQMPRFNLDYKQRMIQGNLTFTEIETIVQYFKLVLVTDDIPEYLPENGIGLNEQITEGKRIYEEVGCRSCHQIGVDGGAVGPNLSNVGNRLTEGYIYMHLENPQALTPDIVEPNYGFSMAERVNLTRYIMSLKHE